MTYVVFTGALVYLYFVYRYFNPRTVRRTIYEETQSQYDLGL